MRNMTTDTESFCVKDPNDHFKMTELLLCSVLILTMYLVWRVESFILQTSERRQNTKFDNSDENKLKLLNRGDQRNKPDAAAGAGCNGGSESYFAIDKELRNDIDRIIENTTSLLNWSERFEYVELDRDGDGDDESSCGSDNDDRDGDVPKCLTVDTEQSDSYASIEKEE